MHNIFRRFATTTAAFAAAVLLSAQIQAQQVVKIDLPAQPLADALRELGFASNTNIIFDPSWVQGITALAYSGTATPEEVLTRLLAGTQLRYKFVDERTVSLMPAPAVKTSGNAPSASEAIDGSSKQAADRHRAAFRLTQTEDASLAEGGAQRTDDTSKTTNTQGADEGSSSIQEVIVTAQKRAERLIDAPQSVTVLSADGLARLGATQIRDYATSVPGLTFTTSGAGYYKLSLRGVTAGADISPTVGLYVDEVPYGTSTQFAGGASFGLDMGLFDLDRIEVLRGPQGTLYGASTMGGLLKYVTKQPDTASFSGSTRAGISGTQDGGISYNASGAVNVPIVADRVALRVSGFESHDGGYIDNVRLGDEDVNRSDVYGGRADLLIAPNDALNIRITGFLQNIARNGEATAEYSPAGVPLAGELQQLRPIPEPYGQHFRLASATVNYALNWASLTSISSYQTSQTSNVFEFSLTYLPLLAGPPYRRNYSAVGLQYDISVDRFTQEVRLASSGAKTLEWLVGGFYTQEKSRNNIVTLLFDPAGLPAPNDVYNQTRPSSFEESAVFGDLTWHFNDRFDVTGGIRYAQNDVKTERVAFGLLVGPQAPTSSSDEVFTYLANARYHFSERATGYVRYATGYRPGGPNFTLRDPVTGLPIGAETYAADGLKSYEVGFKADAADRRYGIDIAGYYIDWNNIQTAIARGGFSGTINAPGGAAIRGGELTLTARPTLDFTVTGAFAYQDAELSAADTDLRAVKGERLPNVPRFTAALNADYELPIGNFQPTVGATLRYVGDRRASFNGQTNQYYLPKYTTVDLRTGFAIGSLNAQLYVRNLFDKVGQLSATTVGSGAAAVRRSAILQPRTVGLQLNYSF